MSTRIFVANQLHKFFGEDTLVKVGVGTAFLKNPKTKYDFGGSIAYENEHVVMFNGLPKRVEIEGVNMVDALQYEHNDFLGYCCTLRQDPTCKFGEFDFEYDGKKYYNIEDVFTILGE